MEKKNSNSNIMIIVIVLLAVLIVLCIFVQKNISEMDKKFIDIKKLELEDTSTEERYVSTKGQRHYYDNVSDVSLTNIKIASDSDYVEYNYNDKCLDIKSSLQYILSPETIENIDNSTNVTLTYLFSDLDKEKAYVIFTSNSIKNTENLELKDRKIDNITIYNIRGIEIFGKEQDGTIATFIKTVGNPSYNYTETVTDKIKNTEYNIQEFIYEGKHMDMILFSSDETNIDRISFEIR